MPHTPVRVTIRVTREPNQQRKPRTHTWVGHERKLALLWESGYFI